jgi:hypothetical protein
MTALLPETHQYLFGHDAVAHQLKTSFDSKKLHHALIFSGAEGVGKKTVAYQLMRYALAYPNGNPKQDDLRIPEEHKILRQLQSGGHTNIMVVTPVFDEKKQRFARDITKDALDGLTAFLRLAPIDDAPRFILVYPAECMSPMIQNKILKILEEPPKDVYFILITSQMGSLLPTIRSRCLTVNFSNISSAEFSEGMKRFSPETSKAKVTALYRLSQGSLGSALMYETEGVLELYGDFCRAVLAWVDDKDTQPAMYFAESLARSSEESKAESVYALWLNRISAVTKAAISGTTLEPIIPEEERVLAVWLAVPHPALLAGYDRIQSIWNEGQAGYLDKKLIFFRILDVLSSMDSQKAAVLA